MYRKLKKLKLDGLEQSHLELISTIKNIEKLSLCSYNFGFNNETEMHGESLSTVAAANLTRKSKLNIESPVESNINDITNEINGLYR